MHLEEKRRYLLLALIDKAQKLSDLSCAAMLLSNSAIVPLRATAPGPASTAQPANIIFCLQLRD